MNRLPRRPREALTDDQRTRLSAGRHAELASELTAAGRPLLAGWVLEEIWDYVGACERYLEARAFVDALRAAMEAGRPALLDEVVVALLEHGDAAAMTEAAEQLERRGRHEEASRLLAAANADPQDQAAALMEAGRRIDAARTLAEAGEAHAALEVLGSLEHSRDPREHALAAWQRWQLGDAEGAARHAQSARRHGDTSDDVRGLLARALGSLGHDLAAQIVLGGDELGVADPETTGRGRYQVTGILPAPFAGSAYVGLDRVTLQEVEVHLLLAEYSENERPGPEARAAVDRFLQTAKTAAALDHPAIRPVLRTQSDIGLLVMPRAHGAGLRSLIRPPGLLESLPRVRSLIAFLLDGIAAGHARGLVHGGLYPSHITLDELGRAIVGPFGAHHLAGLEATRTGGLEEVLVMTAPEIARGAPVSQASDVYAIGILYAAVLQGTLAPDVDALPVEEAELVRAMTNPEPDLRPAARDVARELRVAVADMSTLGANAAGGFQDAAASSPRRPKVEEAVVVTASSGWSDAALAALCAARDPWLQPILDREGRRFYLAAWPEGSRRLSGDTDWRSLLDPRALALLDQAPEDVSEQSSLLRVAVETRLDAGSIIATPSGEWMIALDQLLER